MCPRACARVDARVLPAARASGPGGTHPTPRIARSAPPQAALDGAILYRIGELVSALQRVQAGTRQGGHQHESHARHGTQSVIAFRRSSQTQGQLQGQRNSHSQNQNSPGAPARACPHAYGLD